MAIDTWRVLITGAGSGIGLRTAELLVTEGASVAAVDVDGEGLDRVAALSSGVIPFRLDVRDAAAVRSTVDAAASALGGLDRVVNSAGVFRFEAVETVTEEGWDRTLDINLKGTFLICQAAIPHLVAAGGGRIVNVSSVAGVRAGPDAAPYVASKFGVIGLTKALAVELGPRGIIVNAVAPASIPDTAIGRSSLDQKVAMGWGRDHAEAIVVQEGRYPLRRLGTPDDVARGIRYLLGDDASWMTGQVLSMDGGATAS